MHTEFDQQYIYLGKVLAVQRPGLAKCCKQTRAPQPPGSSISYPENRWLLCGLRALHDWECPPDPPRGGAEGLGVATVVALAGTLVAKVLAAGRTFWSMVDTVPPLVAEPADEPPYPVSLPQMLKLTARSPS